VLACLLDVPRWSSLWTGQFALKQSCEQNGASRRPSFLQVGHLSLAGWEQLRPEHA